MQFLAGSSPGRPPDRPSAECRIWTWKRNSRQNARKDSRLYTPTIALGVLESTLHLLPQHLCKHRSADGARARLGDICCAVSAREDALERLFDPVRFERKSKGIA